MRYQWWQDKQQLRSANVFSFLARVLGLWFIAIALVSFVVDCTRSIAASAWVITPMGQVWFDISPGTLNAAQAGVQRHISPFLWDPILQGLLQYPAWVIFTPLGLLLIWYGDRRRKLRASLL